MRRIEAIANGTPGRQAHRGHRRPVDPAGRQRAEFRRHVRDARRLPPAHEPRPVRPTRSPPSLQDTLPRGDHGRAGERLSAPRRSTAWAPRAASRSSSRTAATTACRLAGRRRADRRRAGTQDHQSAGTVQQLPRRYPLALPRHRPRRRPRPWACRWASCSTPAGLSGLALRQRLQPLRPHLAGQRPGRRQLPQAGRRHQATEDAQPRRAPWCRWARSPASAASAGR